MKNTAKDAMGSNNRLHPKDSYLGKVEDWVKEVDHIMNLKKSPFYIVLDEIKGDNKKENLPQKITLGLRDNPRAAFHFFFRVDEEQGLIFNEHFKDQTPPGQTNITNKDGAAFLEILASNIDILGELMRDEDALQADSLVDTADLIQHVRAKQVPVTKFEQIKHIMRNVNA